MQSSEAVVSCMNRRTAQVTTRRTNLEEPGVGQRDPGFGQLWDGLRGITQEGRLGISLLLVTHDRRVCVLTLGDSVQRQWL